MLVLSKRNIVIPAPDGSASVRLRAGLMETVPDWAVKTPYFQALAADGKISQFAQRAVGEFERISRYPSVIVENAVNVCQVSRAVVYDVGVVADGLQVCLQGVGLEDGAIVVGAVEGEYSYFHAIFL